MAKPDTATRYIGFCPVCTRNIKVRDGVLVHHGYERPGHGYIVGDCFGVGRPPHELSVATAKAWRDAVRETANATRKQLDRLPSQTTFIDLVYRYGGRQGHYDAVEVHKANASAYDWNVIYNRNEKKLQAELFDLEREVSRAQELVDTWVLLPLRTVEEDLGKKKEAAGARQSARDEARAKKLADKIVFYQKKFVSLQKRLEKAKAKLAKTPQYREFLLDVQELESSISQLPEDAVRGLRTISNYTLSKEEALSMLGFSTPSMKLLKNKLLR